MGMIRIVGSATVLIGKAPVLLIWLLYQRRVGIRAFRRQLLRAGLHPEHADDLTAIYRSLIFPGWKQWRLLISQRSHTGSTPLALVDRGRRSPATLRRPPAQQLSIAPAVRNNRLLMEQRTSRGYVFRYNKANRISRRNV